MKKFRSRLAIVLMLMLVFVTSFELIGVFAEDGVQGEPVVTEEAEGAADAVVPEAGAADLAAPEAEAVTDAVMNGGEGGEGGEGGSEGGDTPTPPEPTPTPEYAITASGGLEAFSSYKSVVLEWNKATATKKTGETEEAAEVVYKVNGADVSVQDLGSKVRYTAGGLTAGVDAGFTVEAYVKEDPTKTASIGSATKAPVRTIAYKLKIKKGGTLKSHGGPKAKMKVKAGQTIYAYGFGGGKYILENENGSIFYCNVTRTGKKSCVYSKSLVYSPKEAEFFVNAKGLSSKTSSLVWVNTYTQHLYVFTGSAGNWTCVHDNKCSTGKAKTPAPTGVSGNKTIWKKIKRRHGIKWWSPYSDINSIHSKKKAWKIGVPSSNGCIRNYEPDAKFVYYNAPIGTKVLIY